MISSITKDTILDQTFTAQHETCVQQSSVTGYNHTEKVDVRQNVVMLVLSDRLLSVLRRNPLPPTTSTADSMQRPLEMSSQIMLIDIEEVTSSVT